MLKSIKSKMLVIIVALMTVTMFAVIWTTKKNFEIEVGDIYEKLLQDTLDSAMYVIAHEYDRMASYGPDSISNQHQQPAFIAKDLKGLFSSLKFIETGHLFIFDSNGNLLVHPGLTGKGLLLGKTLMQKLTVAARNSGKPVEHLCPIKEKQKHLTYVSYFEPTDWYVAVSISHDTISVPVTRLITRQGYVILLILLAGSVITIFLSRKITTPLLKLARYAKELPREDLATGHAHPHIRAEKTDDEIGQLAEAFMSMRKQLRRNIRSLSYQSEINSVFAELSEALIRDMPIDEMSTLVLEHAKQLTGSAYGYAGYVDPHTKNFIVPTLTRDIWEDCQIPDKDIVFEKFVGLWGWVLENQKPLLTNLPSADIRSSGTPKGHVPIHRFLSVPATIGDRVVGQISLANPKTEFTQKNLELTERLASLFALAVRRKNRENALRRAHDELEHRVKERTAELSKTNQQLRQEIEIRKRTENALKESEKLYRTLIEVIPYGISETDTSLTITFANPSYHRILGYDEGELIGKSIPEEIVIDSYREKLKTHVKMLLKEQPEPMPWMGKDLTKDGRIIDVQIDWNYNRDKQGVVKGFVTVITDITERTQADRLMRIQRDLGIALNCTSGLAKALNRIMDALLEIDEIDCGGVYLVDGITRELYLIVHRGLSPGFVQHVSHYDADSPNARVAMEKKIIYRSHPQSLFFADRYAQREGLRSLAVLPIQYEGEVVAVLNIGSHHHHEVPVCARNAIEAIGAQIGPVIARVKVENALQESEERFRRQFKSIPVPTFVWQKQNNDYMLIDYNEAAQAITRGQLRNVVASGVYAQDWYSHDYQDVLRAMDACVRERKTVRRQYYYTLRTTGERKFLDTYHVFIPPDMVMTHAIDLTDRKHAEDALNQAVSELRVIFDTIPGMMVVMDMEYKILKISSAYLEAFGLTKNETIIGRKCYEVLKKKTYVCPECVTARVFSNGHPATRFSTSEEERITGKAWKIYIAPLKNNSGKVTGAVKILMDTSDLKDMAHQLRKAKYVAESANTAKSEFLANMSHELRTPLNGILGYTQMLKRDNSLTNRQKDQIDIIHRCGEHLLMMVNDILDLSKIEARKMDLKSVDFHFPSFLRTIVKIARIQAQQKGISFEYDLSPDLPAGIRGDEKRLRQILLNLLNNAVKFTPEGSVVFTVSQEERHEDHIPGRSIRFTVEDTGIGIPKEDIKQIFLPFHQVGDTRNQAEGTGQGLAISQKLVHLMGSKLYMESTVGQGSKFWFSVDMPEFAWRADPIEKQTYVIGYKGKRRKILIADDMEINRLVLKNILLPLGFDILEAVDGYDTLDKAAYFHPDMILMNLIMPGIDGFEATRQIRNLPKLGDVSVIAVSAETSEEVRKACMRSGCDAYVAKPVDVDNFFDVLQGFLNLEWICEENDDNDDEMNSRPEPELVIPCGKEIDRLISLAMTGDIEGIQNQAREIESSDPRFVPFGQKIHRLAKNFQLKKIKKFLSEWKMENGK